MVRKVLAAAAALMTVLAGAAHAAPAQNPLAPWGASSHLPGLPSAFGAGMLTAYALLFLAAAFIAERKGGGGHH